jgi:ribosomal protein S18 acetylase RimI-like enzyme
MQRYNYIYHEYKVQKVSVVVTIAYLLVHSIFITLFLPCSSFLITTKRSGHKPTTRYNKSLPPTTTFIVSIKTRTLAHIQDTDDNQSNEDNHRSSCFVMMERVSNRSRALDVKVFRGFSIPVSEYIQKQLIEHNLVMTEKECEQILTSSYDDYGQDTSIVGEPLVQFVAVVSYNQTSTGDGILLSQNSSSSPSIDHEPTNGVVGVINAQIKRKENGISVNSAKNNNKNHKDIPWPHVSLKNLNVHTEFRRKGIASALVQQVKQYAEKEAINAIVLEVECDNDSAVRLYLKEGFKNVTTSGGDMIYYLNNSICNS